jgi:hypothetical protein
MPPVLVVLGTIALVLYILFGYLVPPSSGEPDSRFVRQAVATMVVFLVLVIWYLTGR